MTREEHETTINFDYAGQVVRIYTTRDGVISGIRRRLGDDIFDSCEQEVHSTRDTGFTIAIPMQYCRNAHMIVKVMNPDEKGTFPEGLFDLSEEGNEGELNDD